MPQSKSWSTRLRVTSKKGTCGQDITTFSENKELKQECKHLGIKTKDCYSKLVALTVKVGKCRTDHWCVRACMCVHIYVNGCVYVCVGL